MKRKKYTHLTITDRDRLQALWDKGHKQKEIAAVLNVHKSTISRELARNRRSEKSPVAGQAGTYESCVAHHKAYVRRHFASGEGKKIDTNRRLRDYVIERLEWAWSPDEIAGRVELEQQSFSVSKNTIYRWLYSRSGKPYTSYLYSRRKRKQSRKPKSKRVLIPNRQGIRRRPVGATTKSRYGHFEGDTMVSAKKTNSPTALSVLYERKAKYIAAQKIPSLKPAVNALAIKRMANAYRKTNSLTMDNGIENTKHETIGIPTYFCDPYSSWQKGGVEHAIKMIRRFIPKGVDINEYSSQDVTMIIDMINHKPRKSLNYKTPYEVVHEKNLLKQKSPTG